MKKGARYRASDATMVAIGERMREIQEAAGLTGVEFARHLGYGSQQRLTNYRRGIRVPDLESLIWLHVNLGISLDWLIDGTGRKAVPRHDVLRLNKR